MQECIDWRSHQNESVGFIPTMGALHNGHLSLVNKSKSTCKKTIVSIYINPAQFGANEDLISYPQNLESDIKQLKQLSVDAILLPSTDEMYPEQETTFNYTNNLFDKLEGKTRPHFFGGVTRIVYKLFNIIKPTHAFFGEKDAQQLRVIQKMIFDLKFDIQLIGCPTVRDENGLALSSRNNYLSLKDQKSASLFYKSLVRIQDALDTGEADAVLLKSVFTKSIQLNTNFRVDYISIACNQTLREINNVTSVVLVSAAVYFKDVRLIDSFLYQSST